MHSHLVYTLLLCVGPFPAGGCISSARGPKLMMSILRGLKYVLYAVSLILLLKIWMLRLINFRVMFPLTVIWLICLLQER